ncbi:MAG: universal stress protein [Phenylobacterium sp.]|nr:universal stress protein [Phenylobacterium sp.]
MQTPKDLTAGYGTLLVHAEPGAASTERVEAAAQLARDLGARLIGLGAETFEPYPTPDPFSGYAAGEWVVLIQDQISKNLTAAEAAFRRDAAGADSEWRSAQDYPHDALARNACAADLIVVSGRQAESRTRSADAADVVMNAGRPVLIVPEGRRTLQADTVVVAWKNTRECRRAVADARPFLAGAKVVIVLGVSKPDAAEAVSAEVSDVVANLRRHGVEARGQVEPQGSGVVTETIQSVADAAGADLIVCGAYGHSRLREWVFGGVTDDLIHRPGRFILMSH